MHTVPGGSGRRSFLQHTTLGLTGGLLAAGSRPLWAQSPAAHAASTEGPKGLKIKTCEAVLLTGIRGYGPWLFCRVETEDGLVGWGEGTNFPGVQPIAAAIRNLSTIVVGQSAWNIEQLWNRMYRFLYYNGMGGVVLAAISAIDIALYDIVGQKLGVPVYQLLGGKVQERLRVYANGWTEGVEKSPASYAKRTKELVAKGYTGCKFDPFSGSPMNREVTQPQLREAVALVKAIREAGGPDYDIAIDVHARWNTKSTIEIIRAIQGFRLFFYEEAVPPENIEAMIEVQRVVDAPLATGERIFGRHGFRELLERQAVRIIQPDIARTGGITEFKKIAAMADSYYIPVAPHNPNGPICTVASIHACISIPNFLILEFFEPDEAVFNEIIPGGLRGDRGSIPPIEGAGLGIRITDDFLKKHAFDEKKTDEMEKRVFDTITFR